MSAPHPARGSGTLGTVTEQAGGWRKSRYCQGGSCVEARTAPGTVLVRDSALDGSPVLEFSPGAWAAFTAAARR